MFKTFFTAYVVGMYVVGSFVAITVGLCVLIVFFCCRKRTKNARNLQNVSFS